LKTKPREFLRSTWRGLTEVPGWPDAPAGLRLRRSLPMLAPVVATMLLLAWDFGYTTPRLRAAHQAHQPLLKLEREVAGLNLAFSEQQVDELAVRESTILRQLPRSTKDVREVLQLLEREAGRLGWSMSCSTPVLPEEAARSETLVAEVPVRVRLKPEAENPEPFTSLLTFLERIPAFSQRIGLMRLVISADEGRWQSVEVGLRFTIPLSHAQAAQ
jgi:hypothetical protein